LLIAGNDAAVFCYICWYQRYRCEDGYLDVVGAMDCSDALRSTCGIGVACYSNERKKCRFGDGV
jgi:hypothetical protein